MAEKKHRSTPPASGGGQADTQGPDGPLLHRPGDDIPNRPRLKVKQQGEPKEAPSPDAPRPATLRGTLFGPQKGDSPLPADMSPQDVSEDEKSVREAKTVVVPPPNGYPFATHRPPLPDEKAEKAELAAITGRKVERDVSTGFVLGIALVVIMLVGGVLIAKLGNKVAALETRVHKLEGAGVQTAALDQRTP